MASPAQIAANRANAKKSTGPRSAEGKSASRFNALTHGIDADSLIIPGEDPAVYHALAADYHAHFRPVSPSELFHVDTMLRADWQKRRLLRVEADLFRTLLADSPAASLAAALLAESPAAKLLARVQRQIAAFERCWYRANRDLQRDRRVAEPPADALFERLFALPELASFPQEADSDSPEDPDTSEEWPPIHQETGQPAYFVG